MAGTPSTKYTLGPGAFGRGLWGRSPVPKMKNGRGPFKHGKGEKGKKEKGKKRKRKNGKGKKETGGIRKKMASSKILTHGLGSLKGSPQSEKKKKERCAATIPLSGLGRQHHINRSQSQSVYVVSLFGINF